MRLFEFTNSFVDDMVTSLRVLQGRGASKQAPQQISWDAISSILEKNGIKVDYETFAKLVDQSPELKNLIMSTTDNFNSPDGIKLKTGFGDKKL
jgi:hypothetical protein